MEMEVGAWQLAPNSIGRTLRTAGFGCANSILRTFTFEFERETRNVPACFQISKIPDTELHAHGSEEVMGLLLCPPPLSGRPMQGTRRVM